MEPLVIDRKVSLMLPLSCHLSRRQLRNPNAAVCFHYARVWVQVASSACSKNESVATSEFPRKSSDPSVSKLSALTSKLKPLPPFLPNRKRNEAGQQYERYASSIRTSTGFQPFCVCLHRLASDNLTELTEAGVIGCSTAIKDQTPEQSHA